MLDTESSLATGRPAMTRAEELVPHFHQLQPLIKPDVALISIFPLTVTMSTGRPRILLKTFSNQQECRPRFQLSSP